jgi:hypothetical protein
MEVKKPIDGDATQAAIRAGYSAKTANPVGLQTLATTDKAQQNKKRDLDQAIDLVFESLGLDRTKTNPNEIGDSYMPIEIAEQHGRMATIAMACYGCKEMAHRAIDRAFEVYAEKRKPVAGKTYMAELVSIRIANNLVKNGVRTVEDCCLFSRYTLATLGGFDLKTAIEIETILQRHGFDLRPVGLD